MFKRPLFLRRVELWTVGIDEGIELVAITFYSKNRAVFPRGGRAAGTFLVDVQDNVDAIHFGILRLGGRAATATLSGHRVDGFARASEPTPPPPWDTGGTA